jgi:hypothetical protein
MSTRHRPRTSTTQPELPLASPPAPTDGRRPGDWHLDEVTRRLGRDGVAAARALLGESGGTDGRKRPEGERQRTGRAA